MPNPNTVSGGGSGNYKINANYNNRVSNNVISRRNDQTVSGGFAISGDKVIVEEIDLNDSSKNDDNECFWRDAWENIKSVAADVKKIFVNSANLVSGDYLEEATFDSTEIDNQLSLYYQLLNQSNNMYSELKSYYEQLPYDNDYFANVDGNVDVYDSSFEDLKISLTDTDSEITRISNGKYTSYEDFLNDYNYVCELNKNLPNLIDQLYAERRLGNYMSIIDDPDYINFDAEAYIRRHNYFDEGLFDGSQPMGAYTDFDIYTNGRQISWEMSKYKDRIDEMFGKGFYEEIYADVDYGKISMYIWSKYGDAAALLFLHDMESKINSAYALKKAIAKLDKEKDSSDFIKYASLHFDGIINGIGNFEEGVSAWFSENPRVTVSDYEEYWISRLLLTGKYGDPAWMGITYELGESVGNMLPSAALAAVNPALGSAALGISSGGNTYKELRWSGVDLATARFKGLLAGASEVATERLLGSIPFLSETNVTGFKTWVISMGKEGTQEIIQDAFTSFLMDGKIDLDPEKIAKTFLIAGLTAGEMNLPGLISGTANSIIHKEDINKLSMKEQQVIDKIRENLSEIETPDGKVKLDPDVAINYLLEHSNVTVEDLIQNAALRDKSVKPLDLNVDNENLEKKDTFTSQMINKIKDDSGLFGFHVKKKNANNTESNIKVIERSYTDENGFQINENDFGGFLAAKIKQGWFTSEQVVNMLSRINSRGYISEALGNYIESIMSSGDKIYVKTVHSTDVNSIFENGIYCNGTSTSGYGTMPSDISQINLENTITVIDGIYDLTSVLKSSNGISQGGNSINGTIIIKIPNGLSINDIVFFNETVNCYCIKPEYIDCFVGVNQDGVTSEPIFNEVNTSVIEQNVSNDALQIDESRFKSYNVEEYKQAIDSVSILFEKLFGNSRFEESSQSIEFNDSSGIRRAFFIARNNAKNSFDALRGAIQRLKSENIDIKSYEDVKIYYPDVYNEYMDNIKRFNEISEYVFQNELAQYLVNMSQEAFNYLASYSGMGLINETLRKGISLTDSKAKMVSVIDKSINKFSLPENMVLHRAIDFKYYESEFSKLGITSVDELSQIVGKSLTDLGYSSTTIDAGGAGPAQNFGIVIDIYAEKGQKAFAYSELNLLSNENEILLPRNTQYTFFDYEVIDGVIHLKATIDSNVNIQNISTIKKIQNVKIDRIEYFDEIIQVMQRIDSEYDASGYALSVLKQYLGIDEELPNFQYLLDDDKALYGYDDYLYFFGEDVRSMLLSNSKEELLKFCKQLSHNFINGKYGVEIDLSSLPETIGGYDTLNLIKIITNGKYNKEYGYDSFLESIKYFSNGNVEEFIAVLDTLVNEAVPRNNIKLDVDIPVLKFLNIYHSNYSDFEYSVKGTSMSWKNGRYKFDVDQHSVADAMIYGNDNLKQSLIQIVKNRYPLISNVEAVKFLMSMEGVEGSDGICNYADVASKIFVLFENHPELSFESSFGFPMFDEQGHWNDALLLADMFVNITGDRLISIDNDGNIVANETNVGYLNLAVGAGDEYYNFIEIERYLRNKGINCTVSQEPLLGSFSTLLSNGLPTEFFTKNILMNVLNALENSKFVSLIGMKGLQMVGFDGTISLGGDHIVPVFGITPNGDLRVDSWGGRWLINVYDAIKNNNKILINSLDIKLN